MIFNGIEKPYIIVAKGRVLPFFAPLNRRIDKFDSRLITTEKGTRIISVPIYIEHEGYSHFQRLKEDIAKWLVHRDPKVLEFKDDPDRFYWAVTDGEIENVINYDNGAEAVIKFACGYKYGIEKIIEVDDSNVEEIGGHTATPWETKTVFNESASHYEFKFHLQGGDTSIRSINVIKLNYEFIPGDMLRINFRKREVTLNGNDITNAVVILQSNFMNLPEGVVEFTASHFTQVFYNERYY